MRPAHTLWLALLAPLSACAVGGLDAPIVGITGLSTEVTAVGRPLGFEGSGFPDPDDGWVDVTFVGRFVPDDGSGVTPVDLTVPLAPDAEGVLAWERFGGHRVPFVSSGDKTGVFQGRVFATHRYFDGTTRTQPEGARPSVTLRVGPSLVVRDFRAVGDSWISDCLEPAPNVINHLPYALRVAAIGFEPETIEVHVSEGLLVDGETTTETTRFEVDGGDGEHAVLMQFAPVPQHVDGYRMSINAYATTVDGQSHDILFPFVVRRPLEVYFTGGMEVAEIFRPDPVTGCIPGGPGGVEVGYSESHSETRTRSVERSVTRGWERSQSLQHEASWSQADSAGGARTATRSVSMSDATTRGGSVTTTDMFSATNGRSRTHSVDFSQTASGTYEWGVGGEQGWSTGNEEYHSSNWSAGGGVSGGVNIGIASFGAEANGERGFVDGESSTRGQSGSTSQSRGGSVGASASVGGGSSDTTSSSATEAHSRSEGRHWARTQTYTEAASFSRTETWNRTRTLGEAERHTASVAESLGLTESEIYSVSTTDAQSLDVRATIAPGDYGVWYRQATRLSRRGTVVAYDLCGNGSEVGELQLEDWTWAPDLALGEACPPEPNLPAAECRIEPCGG